MTDLEICVQNTYSSHGLLPLRFLCGEFLKMMLHDYLAVDNPYTSKETEAEEPIAEKPKWQQAM